MPSSTHEKLLEPTIPVEFVCDALQSCDCRGIDRRESLLQAGLDPGLLSARGGRVSVADYSRLIELTIQAHNDGFLGFLDDRIPVKSFSVFAAQLAACHNLEQVVLQANRFFGLFTSQFKLELKSNADSVRVRLRFRETQSYDYRFIYTSILLVFIRLVNWLFGEVYKPKSVCFSFDQSHLDQEFQYLFSCAPRYCCSQNEVHFDPNLLQATFSTNLAQVDEMLRDSNTMVLLSHKSLPFSREIRRRLLLHDPSVWPGIEEIARDMRLSKNLLWRKLKKENTRFLEIRDNLKRDLAMSLMSDPEKTNADIAEKLGYADLSSFSKAFRKWTGTTPGKYRSELSINLGFG